MKLPKGRLTKSLFFSLSLTLGLGALLGAAIAQTNGEGGSPAPGESPAPIEVPPPVEVPPPSEVPPPVEVPPPSEVPPPVEAPPPLGHDLSNPTEIGPSPIEGGSQPVLTPGDTAQMIDQIEINQSSDYASYFGFNLYGENTSAENISKTLGVLAEATGVNSALIYVMQTPKGLRLTLVLPSSPDKKSASRLSPDWLSPSSFSSFFNAPFTLIASLQPRLNLAQQSNPPAADPSTPKTNLITRLVPDATSAKVKRVVKSFRKDLTDPTKTEDDGYKVSAQQLHDWIIAPLKADLEANNVETIVFSLDKGFRAMPVAALYDGQKFLVEQYNLALIPSFSLTDTRYQGLKGSKMLGMGITQSTGGLSPLPSVAVEVPTLTSKIWQGSGYLDQQSTIEQFKTLTQQERFSIIHLATHALFNPGKVNESYIQFWNERLTLPQLRKISLSQKWTAAPNIEMLVLSACQSALGNDQAELGFTGLAVQSGVKTAVGSLWSVSDEGSLGLMSEFYRSLKTAPIRAAALREAQLGLLQGQVKVTDGQLQLRDGTRVALPDAAAQSKSLSFTHPYYWSAFTMIGNWN
jgi:CHAT domain-containing protein